jgi:hypothetical protein
MVALAVAADVSASSKTHNYCIHLRISPAEREDTWDLGRLARYYGGVAVSDYYFAFPNEEHWLRASEALRLHFGAAYFEPVELAENWHD